ncbi:hypothetical protein P9112_001543 [Eukaryota sp. TZLM1-RC]
MLSLEDLSEFYIKNEPNARMRTEIADLVKAGSWDILKTRMTPRLAFGTAGLRGKMEGGFNRMNSLVILQTTQGLVSYLETAAPDLLKSGGIVIGFDGRYHSEEFARAAASVILGKGYPCHLISELTVTPMIPYAVEHFKCAAGIMVTASHNPKEDNGYKVYWNNGCQIIPPHDSGIQNAILENLDLWTSNIKGDEIHTHPKYNDPYNEIIETYFSDITNKVSKTREVNATSSLKITYTAMHGTGYKYATLAAEAAGLSPLVPVMCQVLPDPDFPTIEFPNPEEGEGALSEAMKTADDNNSTIILAHDPDADRLAVAEKQRDGKWKVFTGNEIGALIGWWRYHCWKQEKGQQPGAKAAMLASTVSSKFLGSMAKKEGFLFNETLTGFKWLGHAMIDLQAEGYDVLLAYEQAIGFATGLVKDKDGVSALVVFNELANHLAAMDILLSEQYEKLSDEYGHFVSKDGYFICEDQQIIDEIFARIRNNGEYLKLEGYEIARIRDLTKPGLDTAFEDKKPKLPVSSSHMITWTFENGAVVTLRTSGTEPKVKYYSEMHADSKDKARELLSNLIEKLLAEWVQPQKYDLPRRE